MPLINQTDMSRGMREKLIPAWSKRMRYTSCCGGTRSGKTYSILQMLVMQLAKDEQMNKPSIVVSVVSETLPHLKRGAIRDFKKVMVDVGIWDDNKWSKSDNIFTFGNGSIIEFFSADSPAKVHGPAREILFINEAQNISFDIARQLFVRTKKRIILDYNPTHPFWLNEKIEVGDDCVVVHTTYKDNEFLTPEQIKEIESNKTDANWWRIYGEGKVGQLEGVIYDFEQIDAMPEKSDGMIETYGIDFGFTNDPTAIVHCYIHKGRKELYLDEVGYNIGLLNRDIVELLKTNDVPLRKVEIFADAAEPKSIAEIGYAGFNIKPCYKSTRKAEQVAFVKQFKIYVTKQSTNIIKELRNYVWMKDKDGRHLNEPTPINDHAMDAFRYAVFTPLSSYKNTGYYRIIT